MKPRLPRRPCAHCAKPLVNRHSKFCNHQCQIDYQYSQYITRWFAGQESGEKYPGEIAGPVRRWLFLRAKHACEKCKWAEVNPTSGRIPLTANHIDGNSRNTVPTNLELLCPNCHSLTSSYGNLNRGNGRRKRLGSMGG